MPQGVFVDTWGWVALGHRKDARHKEIKDFYQGLRKKRSPLFTSDYVLDELITLLFRRETFEESLQFMQGIFMAADQGYLTIERITSARFTEAWELRRQFDDKPLISFTDLTSIVLMKELGLTRVLSEDDHFIKVGMGFQKVP